MGCFFYILVRILKGKQLILKAFTRTIDHFRHLPHAGGHTGALTRTQLQGGQGGSEQNRRPCHADHGRPGRRTRSGY